MRLGLLRVLWHEVCQSKYESSFMIARSMTVLDFKAYLSGFHLL